MQREAWTCSRSTNSGGMPFIQRSAARAALSCSVVSSGVAFMLLLATACGGPQGFLLKENQQMVTEPAGSAGVLVLSYQNTRDFAVLPRRNPSGARTACARLAGKDRGSMKGDLLSVAETM